MLIWSSLLNLFSPPLSPPPLCNFSYLSVKVQPQLPKCTPALSPAQLSLLALTLFLTHTSDHLVSLAQRPLMTPQSIQSKVQLPQSGTSAALNNLTSADISVLPLWGPITASPHSCTLWSRGEGQTNQPSQECTSISYDKIYNGKRS